MSILNLHDEAIRRLASGFVEEFAEFAAGDERMHELMMELASEFVDTNLPIVREDDSIDVAHELMMGITIRTVWLINSLLTNTFFKMDYDTFDTDIFSEINDMPGEIYDVIEYKEEGEDDKKFDVEGYIKGKLDY